MLIKNHGWPLECEKEDWCCLLCSLVSLRSSIGLLGFEKLVAFLSAEWLILACLDGNLFGPLLENLSICLNVTEFRLLHGRLMTEVIELCSFFYILFSGFSKFWLMFNRLKFFDTCQLLLFVKEIC